MLKYKGHQRGDKGLVVETNTGNGWSKPRSIGCHELIQLRRSRLVAGCFHHLLRKSKGQIFPSKLLSLFKHFMEVHLIEGDFETQLI